MCRKNKAAKKKKDDCQLSVSDWLFERFKKGLNFKTRTELARGASAQIRGRVGDIQGVYEPVNSSRNQRLFCGCVQCTLTVTVIETSARDWRDDAGFTH